jgi:DNA-binding transcriptional LysR family regulator
MIDVRRLRALRELVSAGSFSGAAQALGYTQSAISQQIAALERETGLHLVERGTRPTALTDAGRLLLDTAEPIFGHLAKADAAVKELAGRRAQQLRLAGFPTACATILPPAIARVLARHADLEISLVEAEPGDAARALKAGRIDLAVAYTYPALREHDDPALEHTILFDDQFRLVLPRRHRLAGKRRLKLRDLASEAWIVPPAGGPSSSYRRMLLAACRDVGFEPRIAFEIEDTGAGAALVAAGLGLALLASLALDNRAKGTATRDLDDAPTRRIVATRLPGPKPTAALNTTLQVLDDLAGRFSATPSQVD